MFARRVYMHLKPNSVAEFTQRLEKDILPLLRKQKGFQDEITFVGQGGTEALESGLWDTPESAEAYNRGTYPEVTKLLATIVDGAPQVETFNVTNSTFHKIAAAVAAEAGKFPSSCGRQIRSARSPEMWLRIQSQLEIFPVPADKGRLCNTRDANQIEPRNNASEVRPETLRVAMFAKRTPVTPFSARADSSRSRSLICVFLCCIAFPFIGGTGNISIDSESSATFPDCGADLICRPA